MSAEELYTSVALEMVKAKHLAAGNYQISATSRYYSQYFRKTMRASMAVPFRYLEKNLLF